MKKKQSLLFKQGRKGIFKFKVQFIIIIILSFLSVFILTTSLNLRDRLNATYNQVVKSVAPFEYYNQDTAYGNGSSTSDSMTQILIKSALDAQASRSYINADEFTYNVAFNEAYYGANFVTRAFESVAMQSLVLNTNETINTSFSFKIQARNILIDSLYDDIINGLTPNSALHTFVYDNQSDSSATIEEQLNWDRQQAQMSTITFANFNDPLLFTYIVNICESVLAFWANVETTFSIDNVQDLYIFITGNSLSAYTSTNQYVKNWVLDEQQNKKYASNAETPNGIILDYTITDSSTVQHDLNQLVLEHGLRGLAFPIFAITNQDTITYRVDVIANNAFELQASNEDWSGKISGFEERINTESNFKELLYQQDASQGPQTSAYEWIFSSHSYNPNAPIDYRMPGLVTSNLASMYFFHLKVAASFAHITLETRREFTIFDNKSQIQTRAVILDETTMSKMVILNEYQGGRAPVNAGEVLISEQFAKAQNIKVNENIKLGAGIYTVSGFATDTFSYYPISDDSLPIPQSKNSAIIYATAATFNTMRKNTSVAAGILIPKVVFRNFVWTKANSDLTALHYLYNSTENPTSFADSAYAMSWTLQPLVVKLYTAFTLLLSLTVAIIAIVGLVISTKKTIQENAKQIGILKAIGYEPVQIAITYIAQAVFVSVFVIPLGWIIGLVTQSAYVQLFIPYFSLQLHQFTISFIPLAIAYLIFGVFSIFFSFMTAYWLTNKPVIAIMTHTDQKIARSRILDWMNRVIFAKAKFSVRFSLNMTSTNKKNITLMTLVVLASSFLVSIGFSIPSTVQSIQEGYYRNINYANSYDYYKPIANAPLSKGALKYVEDPAILDANFHITTTQISGEKYLYSNPKYYFDSAYDASPLSKYLYLGMSNQTPNFENTLKYLATDQANQNQELEPNSLLNILSEQFGNNFAQGLGSQFSIGTIEQVMTLVFNTWDGAQGNGTFMDDATVEAIYNKITGNLTQAIPTILSQILGTSVDSDLDWKSSILSVISKAAPPFVQSYLADESRKEQYVFGYGVKKVVKNQETLTTKINLNNDKYTINAVGIDANQQAFNLSSSLQSRLFVDPQLDASLEHVFNGTQTTDIVLNNGFKLYDASSNTLTAPIVGNNQAVNTYNLNRQTLKQLTAHDQQLLFETSNNDYQVLPSDAWVYDDRDFLTSDYYQTVFDKSQQSQILTHRSGVYDEHDNFAHSYLNLQNLDNNKFTYRNLYPDDQQLDVYSYLFNDFAVDDEQDGVSYVRPYYEYRNVKLFLPKTIINNTLDANNINKWANNIYGDHADLDQYFDNDVSNADVPDSVKNAWEKLYGTRVENANYIAISPYALEYGMKKADADNHGLANITDTNAGYLWYTDAMTAGLLKQEDAPIEYLNQGLTINFANVGSLDSYNGNLILIDQTLANLINNYSIRDKYDLKNNILSDEPIYHAGEMFEVNGQTYTSLYDKYAVRDVQNDLYVDNWTTMLAHGSDSLQYHQKMWSNAKLSNIVEPIDLTSGFVQTTQENNGLLMLGKTKVGNLSSSSLTTIVEGQKLLSTEKELILQITNLAISIATLIIFIVIVTASILIVLIADIYINKYRMFMILMKSFGYNKRTIIRYSFGPVSFLSAFAWLIGTLGAWAMIAGGIKVLAYLGLSLPFTLVWWPIVASLLVVGFAYTSSIIISVIKLKYHEPAEMLKEANE